MVIEFDIPKPEALALLQFLRRVLPKEVEYALENPTDVVLFNRANDRLRVVIVTALGV
jgi:hypothetical protein